MLNLDNPRVALTILPFCSTDTPPVGLAMLTSILRQRGYDVTPLDLNLEARAVAPEALKYLWSGQQMMELVEPEPFAALLNQAEMLVEFCCQRLQESEADVIGFSLFTTNVRFTAEVARRLRQRAGERVIIFGGPSCKVTGEREWMGPGLANAWICGDGEDLLPAVLELDDAQAPAGVILGLDTDPAFTVEFGVVADLEAHPFPDFSQLDPGRYDRQSSRGEPVLPVVASRGCIMRCAFCNERSLEKRYRTRGADHLYAELAHQVQRHGPVAFRFNDQLLNGNLKVLDRLADRIIEGGLDIRWVGQGIARGDMSADLLDRLHRAGLEEICFGLESGSPSVLERMGKNVKLLDPELAIKRTHDAGIRAHINLLVGFPGETEQEFQQTLDLLERCKDHIDLVENIHPFFITPRSAVDLDPAAYGILTHGDHLNRAMMWLGEDGSDYAMRKERVKRIAGHLQQLSIPFDPGWLHLYDEKDAAPESPTDQASPAAAREAQLWLTDLLPLGQDGEPVERLAPGEAVAICARYFVHGQVEDPCFRLQIFTKGADNEQNIFIHGTNTARCGVATGRLDPGHGEVRIHLAALDLGPGTYHVTFGAWPDEGAEQPYDVRHGGTKFEVVEAPGRTMGLISAPGGWLTPGEPGYLETVTLPGPEDEHPLAILNADLDWTEAVTTGAPLTAALRCPETLPAHVRVEGGVFHGGDELMRLTRTLEPGVRGGTIVQWPVLSLPLLAGSYEVRVRLLDLDTDEPILAVGHGLKVSATEEQGAGLVHLAARWELSPVQDVAAQEADV